MNYDNIMIEYLYMFVCEGAKYALSLSLTRIKQNIRFNYIIFSKKK